MSSPMDILSNRVFQVGIVGVNAFISGAFMASANPAAAVITGATAVVMGAAIAHKTMNADNELAELRSSQPQHAQAKPGQTVVPVTPQ